MIPTQSSPTSQHIYLNTECRKNLLTGIQKVADAVSVTLGPKGRTVVLDSLYGTPRVTKDGVSVAKAIEFNDTKINVGVKLAKGVASRINDKSGDGTTTATLLLHKIAKDGIQYVDSGVSTAEFLKGITTAKNVVLNEVKKQSKPISMNDIINVATVSANNDKVIGKMVGEIYERIGKDGAVDVEIGKGLKDSVKIVEGMVIDQGFLSRHFSTDSSNQKVELRNADVLIIDDRLTTASSVVPLLQFCVKRKKPLVILADTIEGDALTTLVLNKLRGLPVAAVRAPAFGQTRKGILQDISIMTGGKVISVDAGDRVENVSEENVGSVDRFISTQDETVFIGGKGKKVDVVNRVDHLKKQSKTADSSYELEKLNNRIARLTGGVAVVSVGGSSETEVGERKDRIEDAVCAVKAALSEGIVPGGGVALIRAGEHLDNLNITNWSEKVGVDLVKRATEEPTKTIARNAGVDGGVVVHKIREKSKGFGYDARDGVFVDLLEKGIVDPTKVVRSAFDEAVSVGSLVATSEGLVVNNQQK
ncbi:Chaperonin 1 60 kDa [Entamoeba marina]